MEWRRTLSKEEEEARSQQRIEMLRLAKRLAEYEENPMIDADVAPHLVGRNRS